jgi:nitrate reductase (cytochrome), electron transfer subunit
VSSRAHASSGVGQRLFLIASAVVAIAALVVAFGPTAAKRVEPATAAASPFPTGEPPLAAEADVFRTNAGVLAIDPGPAPRRSAHPRTLATWRNLRAFPGAPPRIPHGLTPDEFQNGSCNTCHERGGYSQRFGAYVPITPHPEMGACLQCHVGDGQLMAIALPSTDPSARCRQCHTPEAGRWTESTVDWRPIAWPRLPRRAAASEPPPIPHTLEFRANCLSCHAAPAAVAEIRTTHPERADCKQCHLPAGEEAGEFARPARAGGAHRGGAS